MIEIELFDGTILQFPEGTSQEVIDRAAQQQTQEIMQQQPQTPSVARDVATSIPPALARGVMELVGLPGTIAGLPMQGAQALGLVPPDQDVRNIFSGGRIREGAAALTSGATEARPETVPGEYAATISEFLPGAAAGPGGVARNLLRFGAVPGAASEAAGQATKDTAIEPLARALAAIGTSFAASRPSGRSRPIVDVDEDAARMAETLMQQGVTPTVGQTARSQSLMRMEGVVEPTTQQRQDLTAAAMRATGSTANRANPTTIGEAQRTITGGMDDILRNVDVVPPPSAINQVDDVVRNYMLDAPAGEVVPRLGNVADEIRRLAQAGDPVPLDRLRVWRTELGNLTTSSNEATRNAARGLRGVIDDLTDQALVANNRAEDLIRLAELREQYRNWLAVSDASTRAGSRGGLISPEALEGAVIRTQGRQAYATGRGTTPFAETARSGANLLGSLPTVASDARRRLPASATAATAAGAFGLQASAGDPGMALLSAAAGGLIPPLMQRGMRSRAVQGLLMDPRFQASALAARTAPGIMASE
jgi:hypothetical protein